MSTQDLSTRFLPLLLLVTCLASEADAQKGNKLTKPSTKPVLYAAVKSGDQYSVLKTSELTAFKKDLSKEYTESLKQWNKAKKEASKQKTKFTDPRPKRTKLTILGTRYKSEAEAQKAIDKIVQKEKEKQLKLLNKKKHSKVRKGGTKKTSKKTPPRRTKRTGHSA